MPEGIVIEIPTTPMIKEFYESIHGDIIYLSTTDRLHSVINPLLDVVPKKYKPYPKGNGNTVKIKLLWLGQKKIDIRHRNYLSVKAKMIISEILYHDFKETFYSFMLGCVISGRKQREAIELFCKIHNLSMNNTKYETLKKSWYRSDTRKKIKIFPNIVPKNQRIL